MVLQEISEDGILMMTFGVLIVWAENKESHPSIKVHFSTLFSSRTTRVKTENHDLVSKHETERKKFSILSRSTRLMGKISFSSRNIRLSAKIFISSMRPEDRNSRSRLERKKFSSRELKEASPLAMLCFKTSPKAKQVITSLTIMTFIST